MSNEKVTQELKALRELVETALINARESTSPSISTVLFQVQKDIAELKTKMDPLLRDYNESSGFWNRFFFMAKAAGSVTAIGFLIVGIVAFIKKF